MQYMNGMVSCYAELLNAAGSAVSHSAANMFPFAFALHVVLSAAFNMFHAYSAECNAHYLLHLFTT